MPTPTPTTPNPYGPKVMTFDPKPLQSNAAVPINMSLITPNEAARNNVNQAQQQNTAIAEAGGRTAGGSRKRSSNRFNKGKRSNRSLKSSKRSSKRSNKEKRLSKKRSKRSIRGGASLLAPRPTATVPQFGSQHAGANLASAQLNSGAMSQTEQAKFDNPKGPATTTYLQ